VDPTSTDEMLGDDLFPRDFIHLLEPPTNYVGMDRPFPPADPESPEQDALAREAGLRTVEDSDAWLAVDHKQEAVPGPVPQSLRDALNYFLLACPVTGKDAEDAVTAWLLVARLRERLADAPTALLEFNTLLRFLAWSDDEPAKPVVVRLDRIDRHPVTPEFPRLTRASVPGGVADAAYTIILPGTEQTP
jgi:hypothetical protein